MGRGWFTEMSIPKGKPWLSEILPARTFECYPEQLNCWQCPENTEKAKHKTFVGKGLSLLFLSYTHTHTIKILEIQRLHPVFCDFCKGKELRGFGHCYLLHRALRSHLPDGIRLHEF